MPVRPACVSKLEGPAPAQDHGPAPVLRLNTPQDNGCSFEQCGSEFKCMHHYSSLGTSTVSESCPARIAVFIPSLRGGGAERAMLLFAKGLAERRVFEVDLVLAETNGELLCEVPEIVRVVDLKRRRVSRALWPLIRYLNTAEPKVLYSSIVHANVIAVLAKRLARVQTKIIVRESNSPLSSASTTLASRAALRLLPLAYGRAHAVIAVSEGVKDELLRMAPALQTKIAVVPTPVVPENLDHLCSEAAPHPWLKDDAPRYIVAAGRLHPQKDFPTLLRAFAEVRRNVELRLLILGEGSERQPLEKLARELGVSQNVSLPGFVPNPYPYFKHAAAFVLSSRYEGMPNVLIQALACGIPVIATDCPSGPREILGGTNFGELVPVGDWRALAEAIRRTLSAPALGAAAEAMQLRFGVSSSVRSYLNLAGLTA